MAIRAVVFDIGGVLEIVAESSLLGDWATRLGEVWAGGLIGTVTEEQVHAAISEHTGVSREEADELMGRMWAWYLGVPNTELVECLRELRPRYRTGLLSNSFVGAREREQQAYGYAELVDDIVYSHEVGMSKPDPAIYQLTCVRLGVRPGETVFVDDVAANVEAAREVGMVAIHHRDNEETIAALGAALDE